jgi:hypothetical protein
MITTRLQGGLGNQMFQMATAYALSKKLNTDCAFDFNGCHTPNQGNTSSKYTDNLFSNFKELTQMPETTVNWSELSFSHIPIPLTMGEDIRLHGYFQSEKYFKDYRDNLKELFMFPSETKTLCTYLLMKFDIRDLTAVHVRRGDYLKSTGFHTNLSETEYYQKAMNLIGGKFLFISDDIEWCQENFKGDNIFYSSLPTEIDDFCLMTKCQNHIIANSSFSWWGAYLSENNGKVVAPRNWFGPKGPNNTEDLIPDGWIIL